MLVFRDAKEIEKHLSSFLLQPSINHQTKVIGFDFEWTLFYSAKMGTYAKSNCATLQFCDGHSCLIIQLNHFPKFGSLSYDSLYKSQLHFLRLPNVTFVGIGIKENLAKLEKHHGFGIRNAVELGPLAAAAMKMPRLSFCGVDELAHLVNGFDLGEHRPIATDCDWGCSPLNKELTKLTTINVYSYYKIGTGLLHAVFAGGSKYTGLVHLW